MKLLRIGAVALGALGAVALLRVAIPEPERTVLVARHDLVAGTTLRNDDVERRHIPASIVPRDAAPSVTGRVTRITVLAGTAITTRHLDASNARADTRRIALRVEPGLAIQAGDVVDVHATDELAVADVDAALVVSVQRDQLARHDVVTLAVRPDDARILAGATARGTPVALALLPPGPDSGS